MTITHNNYDFLKTINLANLRLAKCVYCTQELRLEQKSIRYKNKWYHAECFKKTITPKKPTEHTSIKNHVYKTTVLSESIYDAKTQTIKTLKPNLPPEKPKTLTQILQKPADIKVIKPSVPKPRQAVAQTIPKIKPQPKTKSGVKTDPVIVVLAIAIFSLLFFAAYSIYTLLSVLSIIVAGIIAFYHILSKKPPHTLYQYKAKGASFYSIAILIMPFAFGIINAIDVIGALEPIAGLDKYRILDKNAIFDSLNRLDGQRTTLAAIQAVFIWSLTLSFWQTMLFVPLAIRSVRREAALTDPPEWPKISVIVPAYNEEKVIQTTIESLLATDYADKEIIVVDDGSKDNTLQIASMYKDRIKVIHKENGGKASALNQGLLYTTGDIVTIVDADTIIGNSSLKHIARAMVDDNVAAAAGNIKIRNKVNWLTWCQSLEYLSGIQIMRRGLDYFGAITIVPGALGAFRKKKLEEAGTYHKETLVEDFDATMKVLRSGMIVNGSNKAVAYTQAPQTIMDFYKQRKRWYRGNLQVLRRHSDILLNPRFGYLHKLSYPLMALHMLVIPFASLLVWGFAIYQIMLGQYLFVIYTFGLYITLQYLLSAMAVRMDNDDKKMILYSVFMVVGYKQITDLMQIKAVIEEVFGKKAIWTSAKRVKQ